MIRALVAIVAITVFQRAPPGVASTLLPRMQLVYASAGRDQPPWTVDSLKRGMELVRGGDCASIFMRRTPTETQAAQNVVCVRGDTLFGFSPTTQVLTAQRPVGAGMTIRFSRPNKDTVIYSTTVASEDTISGLRVPVMLTTVLTVDSLGAPKRRLSERYAVTLLTATRGRFEVPEAPSARDDVVWRTEQEFGLREIIIR